MSMKQSEQGTKKFTQEEKLQIISEASSSGVKETLAKYDLYPATYYYWKRKLDLESEGGLKKATHKEYEIAIKQLTKENAVLKILLAEKELESKLKDDLLKKKYPNLKRWI